MSQIAPFRGVRFNSDRISSIARVVAPPYDVVDPAQEKQLSERDEHNIIRLTMGKTPPEGRNDEDYRRAARLLASWRRDGVLVQDDEPSVYIIEQRFEVNGEQFVRRGFIAAVRLEEFGAGSVHPHERTMDAPRSDRLRLLAACRANLSPMLAMYSDPDGAVDALVERVAASPPSVSAGVERLYVFEDDGGVGHSVWRVCDRRATGELAALMRARALLIADGHHRYESALRYRAARRSGRGSGECGPTDFLPALCISAANRGLKILPTHRCVKAGPPKPGLRRITETLGEHFAIRPVVVGRNESLQAAFDRVRGGEACAGCYLNGGRLYLLVPRDPDSLRGRFPREAELWWRLPVSMLHYVVLPDLLGIGPGSAEESQGIEYRHDAAVLRDGVECGRYAAGFLLPPTEASTMERVAAQGQRLPLKSTYFYPKIGAGLVLYVHEPGSAGAP